MSKRFTVGEAESLLPLLGELLREAVELKAGYQEAEEAFAAMTRRIVTMGGLSIDREQAAKTRMNRDRAAVRLKKTLAGIEETGCVVKDLDSGLLDFPTLFRGREVYLCWKLGEPAIRYWHGTDEGFAGRKPIDDEFIETHRSE
jgi:hypothetical protein